MSLLRRFSGILGLYLILIVSGYSQNLESELKKNAKKYDYSYEKLPEGSFFKERYLLRFKQPIDPNNPALGYFTQRVFLSHLAPSKPVVLITEGYTAHHAMNPEFVYELSTLLSANQICVEHRYFGESAPDSMVWDALTIANAASDHHRIVVALKEIYSGKWVNTGISKGGQTVMYHRYFYPEDVDASVGYVCPLNFSLTDKRVYRFLDHLGTTEQKKKIREYQTELLKNKAKYLPFFIQLANNKGLSYELGYEKSFDLTVFEYSFAFWQWGLTPFDSIPKPGTNPSGMIEHLDKVAGIDWTSEQGIDALLPFYYQALREMGFYGYDISPFRQWTSFTGNPDFGFTAPGNRPVAFDPEPMKKIDYFIRHQAEKMLFIYGETDPWSATAIEPTLANSVVRIVKPGGSHLTRIQNLPEEQKKEAINVLKSWLSE